MSESLEIRTTHRDVSDVVRELAPFIDDMSLRLPSGRRIADGEWVRFSVHLIDGSAVLEGVGRCQESTQEGASTYRVRLSLLSFDATNEVMYERMLLARDLDGEEATGTIDLRSLGEKILKQPPTPPTKSAPPEPLHRARTRPPTRPPPLPRTSTRPPPPLPKASTRPPTSLPKGSTRPPPPSQIPKAPRLPEVAPPVVPRAHLEPPPHAPAQMQTPPDTNAGTKPVHRPARDRPPQRAETPVPTPPEPQPEASPPRPQQTVALAATPEQTSPQVRTPENTTTDTVISARAARTAASPHSGLRLDIPARIVERARALAPTLPPGLATAIPEGETKEEAVLRVALRMGLASLVALSDIDDEP